MVTSTRHWLNDRPRLGDIMAPQANSFGVLRLAMASLVLISHSFLYTSGTDAADPFLPWTGHSLGEHAVQGFFILSGILVAQSFERSRSIVDFVAARALRIFPALIVCVLLTALVLGPAVTRLPLLDYVTSAKLPAYVLKTLSLSTGLAPLPGVFETLPLANAINSSLWTLKYEVLCYAGLAIFGFAGLFRTQWRPVAAAMLLIFLVVVFCGDPEPAEVYTFSDNARYFALYFGTGVLIYLIRKELVITGAAFLPLIAFFAIAVGSRLTEFATAMLIGYAIVWAANLRFGSLRAICNRLDLSFGVYIYAGPIQQALIGFCPGIHPAGIALLAAILVMPLALLSWVFIEHPALNLRSCLRGHRSAGVPHRRIAAVLA